MVTAAKADGDENQVIFHGRAFEDPNQNGIYDSNETLLKGVEVTILKADSESKLNNHTVIVEYTPYLTTKTNSNGEYSVSFNDTGDYQVSIKDPKLNAVYNISKLSTSESCDFDFALVKKEDIAKKDKNKLEKIVKDDIKVNTFKKIQFAYQKGLISHEDKIDLYITALLNKENLPPEYISDIENEYTLDLILEIQKYIKENKDEPDKKDKSDDLQIIIMSITPAQASSYETDHFVIYYSLSSPDDISDITDAYTANFNTGQLVSGSDDHPDVVNSIGLDLEHIYDTICGASPGMGFTSPHTQECILDGNPNDTVDKVMIKLELLSGQLGKCVYDPASPDSTSPYNTYTGTISYDIGLVNSVVPSSPDYKGTTADFPEYRKGVFAHEFFHAVQLAYNGDLDVWFKDMSAQHIMEAVYPSYYTYEDTVDLFLDYTDSSLNTSTAFRYGVSLFAFHLEEDYGGLSTIEEILDTALDSTKASAIRTYDAINTALSSVASSYNLKDVFIEFSKKNYICTTQFYNDYSSDWIENTGKYNYEFTDYSSTITVSGESVNSMATKYLTFTPSSSTADKVLEFTFDGASGVDWGVYLLEENNGSSTIDCTKLSLDASNNYTARISDFESTPSKVILVISNPNWDNTASQSFNLTAYEHTMGSWSITPADCQNTGSQTRVCTKTGCTYSETEILPIDPNAHDWSSYIILSEADCTGGGLRYKECEIPGCSATTSPVVYYDWDNHTGGYYYDISDPATCTTDGTREKRCSGCDDLLSTSIIPALGHDDSGPDATCTTDEICQRCQDVLEEAWGHDWGTYYITTVATCSVTGVKTADCNNPGCNDTDTINYSDPTNHLHVNTWQSSAKTSATCPYIQNVYDWECTWCGDRLYQYNYTYTYDGHDWGSWVFDYSYWDSDLGHYVYVYKRTCSTCGDVEYDEM